MVNPVISFYKSDDTTKLNDNAPEDFGQVMLNRNSDPQVIHIWNDKGGSVGSTPAYNASLKIVTNTGLTTGGTVVDGQEIVAGSWLEVISLTNNETSYVPLGAGNIKLLGDINPNDFHAIEVKLNVPSNATIPKSQGQTVPINFEIQLIYDLTSS